MAQEGAGREGGRRCPDTICDDRLNETKAPTVPKIYPVISYTNATLEQPRSSTDTAEAPIRLPDSYVTTGHAVSDESRGYEGLPKIYPVNVAH